MTTRGPRAGKRNLIRSALVAAAALLAIVAPAPARAEQMMGVTEQSDFFSSALAVGDFDGDGVRDLAIGVPNEDLGDLVNAGAVNVTYGSSDGLSEARQDLWTSDSEGVAGQSEQGDELGGALAAGDFNGDGFDDLAVGAAQEDVGSISQAGAVTIIYGSVAGLTATGSHHVYQNMEGVGGASEELESFGSSLAAGDFDHDTFDDLAVGVVYEDVGDKLGAGAVQIFYGATGALDVTRDQIFDQDSPGMLGTATHHEFFGSTLATGNFGRGSYDDLAVGITGDDVGGSFDRVSQAGSVAVLYGSDGGLSSEGDQVWNQQRRGIPDESEHTEFFGRGLAAADYGRGSQDDLAIGVANENLQPESPSTENGAVHVLYATPDGLSARDDQFWHQGVSGVADPLGPDRFGAALAGGNLGKGPRADLVIGVPFEDANLKQASGENAGFAHVLYGTDDGLSAQGSQVWHQDRSGIGGEVETQDWFARELAIGNFGLGLPADVAIGVLREGHLEGESEILDAGAVNVIYGTSDGLRAVGDQYWHQALP